MKEEIISRFQNIAEGADKWQIITEDANSGYGTTYLLRKNDQFIHASISLLLKLFKAGRIWNSMSFDEESNRYTIHDQIHMRSNIARAQYLVLSTDHKKLLGIRDFGKHYTRDLDSGLSGKSLAEKDFDILLRCMAYSNIHVKKAWDLWSVKFTDLLGIIYDVPGDAGVNVPMPVRRMKSTWYTQSFDEMTSICPKCEHVVSNGMFGQALPERCPVCEQALKAKTEDVMFKGDRAVSMLIDKDNNIHELNLPEDVLDKANGFV